MTADHAVSGGVSARLVRRLGALVLLAGAAFIAALWLGAFAGDLVSDNGPNALAVSRSVEGFYGLTKLLRMEGVSAAVSRTAEQSRTAPGLLVLTPSQTVDGAALATLARGRPTLVILPKWIGWADPRRPQWLLRHVADPNDAQKLLGALMGSGTVSDSPLSSWTTLSWRTGAGAPTETPIVQRFQTMTSPGLTPLAVDADQRLVLGRSTSSELYILSEPDLLNNHGLREIAGAEVASTMIERLAAGRPVTFDLSLSRPTASKNALKLLFTAPFAALTTCLLLAAVLALLHARVRFGPAVPTGRAYDFGKRSLVESTVSLLELARREPKVARRYAALIRATTAAAIGARGVDEADLERELDRLSVRRGLTPWTVLSVRAGSVKSRANLVAWAHDLHLWSKGMSDGRH